MPNKKNQNQILWVVKKKKEINFARNKTNKQATWTFYKGESDIYKMWLLL